MRAVAKVVLGAVLLASSVAVMASAQVGSNEIGTVSVNDPPGPPPNPANVPFIPPEAIKWEGNPNGGSQSFKLFGDSSKPGVYGQLLKWNPGAGTRPHIHDQDRHVWVISGTWWKGSSNPYDAKQSFPMPAGTYIRDEANKVHWDGVRAGAQPAIIYIVGMGPVKTSVVDEQGNPLPPRPRPPAP